MSTYQMRLGGSAVAAGHVTTPYLLPTFPRLLIEHLFAANITLFKQDGSILSRCERTCSKALFAIVAPVLLHGSGLTFISIDVVVRRPSLIDVDLAFPTSQGQHRFLALAVDLERITPLFTVTTPWPPLRQQAMHQVSDLLKDTPYAKSSGVIVCSLC